MLFEKVCSGIQKYDERNLKLIEKDHLLKQKFKIFVKLNKKTFRGPGAQLARAWGFEPCLVKTQNFHPINGDFKSFTILPLQDYCTNG